MAIRFGFCHVNVASSEHYHFAERNTDHVTQHAPERSPIHFIPLYYTYSDWRRKVLLLQPSSSLYKTFTVRESYSLFFDLREPVSQRQSVISGASMASQRQKDSSAGYQPIFKSFATDAIHVGSEPEQWNSRAVVPPISLSTTFKQHEPGKHAVSQVL